MTSEWIGIGIVIAMAACGGIATFIVTSEKAKRNAEDISRVEASLGGDIAEVKEGTRRIWQKVSAQDATLNQIVGKLDALRDR